MTQLRNGWAYIPGRPAQGLKLRLAGLGYREIADRLGYASRASAYAAMKHLWRNDPDLHAAVHAVPAKRRVGDRKLHTGGYVVLQARDHPLANPNGEVLEHRKVLYDQLGPGEHPCRWCGERLDWDELTVDHLNHDRTDNRPDNLVTACRPCNSRRSWRARARPCRCEHPVVTAFLDGECDRCWGVIRSAA